MHLIDGALHNTSLLLHRDYTIACRDLDCAPTEEACPASGLMHGGEHGACVLQALSGMQIASDPMDTILLA